MNDSRRGFPVIDVTHTPKRLQRDNIIQAGTQSCSNSDSTQGNVEHSAPLHNITIERAIQYYESHASGELSTLYLNTAMWLRKLLSVGMGAVNKAAGSVHSEVADEAEKTE